MPNIDLKIEDFSANQKNNKLDKLTNIDAEIAVIGCILWDNRSFEKISDFLNENHFADNNNRNIYKIIKKLLNNNILVTPVTLKNHLQENEFQGINYLTYLNQIKDSAPSTHNAFQYANVVN